MSLMLYILEAFFPQMKKTLWSYKKKYISNNRTGKEEYDLKLRKNQEMKFKAINAAE